MAVTKTHPIKSTLKAAIDYILNPEKTDGKLLASSFGCGLETADIEFAWTREAAGDRGTHLGRHLIQSFAVGETTPEEAHKIGMELAGAVLSCRMVCFPCAGLLFCSKNFWIAFCNACSVSRAAPFPTLTYRAIVFWVTSSCKVSTPFPVKCGYAHSPPYKS